MKNRLAIMLIVLTLAAGTALAQDALDEDAVWRDFIIWFKAAPLTPDTFRLYAAKLEKEGVTEEDADRRIRLIVRMFSERPEGAEIFYDRSYSRPATGDPVEDGYASTPSAFVMDAVKGLVPGTALDVGMGQGRNAVYLAEQGWTVTGFDISGGGLEAARANAAKAGVSIRTEKAAYDDFDFGIDRWDLVLVIFAWAPVSDPGFVARIERSLRPGGVVLFEHFITDAEHPHAPMVRALEPGRLREYFAGFEIVSYEEADGVGDWGGPGSRLVRMIARERG